jgi:hypothetical protein
MSDFATNMTDFVIQADCFIYAMLSYKIHRAASLLLFPISVTGNVLSIS